MSKYKECRACLGKGYEEHASRTAFGNKVIRVPCNICSGFGFINNFGNGNYGITNYPELNLDIDLQHNENNDVKENLEDDLDVNFQHNENDMDTKRVYIAGPMTGYEGFNFDAFNKAEKRIEECTVHKPVNPAGEGDLDEDGNPTKTKEEFIRRDLQKLTKCDSICLLEGWKCSSGAQSEIRAALEMGLDFYTLEPKNEYGFELVELEEPETIMREAEEAITGVKMDAYGEPGEALDKIAGMWNSLFSDKMNGKLTAEDVSLAMIALKLVREENAHKRDNLVDIAGYAGLIELIKDS